MLFSLTLHTQGNHFIPRKLTDFSGSVLRSLEPPFIITGIISNYSHNYPCTKAAVREHTCVTIVMLPVRTSLNMKTIAGIVNTYMSFFWDHGS